VKRKTGAIVLALALLAVMVVAGAGCGGKAPQDGVATVGDTTITKPA